jgi:hypothetical protein
MIPKKRRDDPFYDRFYPEPHGSWLKIEDGPSCHSYQKWDEDLCGSHSDFCEESDGFLDMSHFDQNDTPVLSEGLIVEVPESEIHLLDEPPIPIVLWDEAEYQASLALRQFIES